MAKKKKNEFTQKTCVVYTTTPDGEVRRTRFFKPTSSGIIKRKAEALEASGKFNVAAMGISDWEAEFGKISNEPKKPSGYVNIAFVKKTHDMKLWCQQNRRKLGRTIY